MLHEKILVTGPIEFDYRKATTELVLHCTEPDGRRVEIRFDAGATHGLCRMVGQAVRINQGPLGRPEKTDKPH